MERITRIAPSARLEEQINELLTGGLGEDGEHLAALGRLGARLVLQRAVEEEVAAFLGRTRYERTPTATGSRNGTRQKPIQTAEGEISIAMPQVRNTAERFVSRVIPDTKAVVRTRPLEALVIGSYVRGLSDRDIEIWPRRLGWARFPRARSVGSAASCATATRRSAARACTTSACSRCFWTPSTCPRDRVAPRRECWWPGATQPKANGCWWPFVWASASRTRIGWISVVISPAVDSVHHGWWSATEHRG
jgi:putative transposase